TDLPPLLDYPNHLARSFILQHWTENPALQHWYRPNWQPIPDLGHDLVMAMLMPFVDLETAGRLLLALIQLTTLGGVFALHRALRDTVPAAHLAIPVAGRVYRRFLKLFAGAWPRPVGGRLMAAAQRLAAGLAGGRRHRDRAGDLSGACVRALLFSRHHRQLRIV